MKSNRLTHAMRLGLRSLAAHRLRSALTALGIILGVASVIVMLAVGEAAALDDAALIVVASPTKSTVGCAASTICEAPGLTVTVTVFVSAVVEAIVAVVTPSAFVGPAGCVMTLLEPEAAICTA